MQSVMGEKLMLLDLKFRKLERYQEEVCENLKAGFLEKECLEMLGLIFRDLGEKKAEIESILSVESIEKPEDLVELDFFLFKLFQVPYYDLRLEILIYL